MQHIGQSASPPQDAEKSTERIDPSRLGNLSPSGLLTFRCDSLMIQMMGALLEDMLEARMNKTTLTERRKRPLRPPRDLTKYPLAEKRPNQSGFMLETIYIYLYKAILTQ